jgi:predicted dehydrogenase
MGWMGTVHSRSYMEIPNRFPDSDIHPRLVVCADEVEKRARAGPGLFSFERSTTDWREVVTDPEVEAVIITAPNNMHVEMVRAAVAAGKHVFCEKPVGRGPEETAEIESLAREAGVLTGVGYNYRWAPVVQYAHQLIRDGRLGDLTHYRGRFFVGYGSDPRGVLSWRFQRDLAGLGALGDLMSHVIDMAHMMAGPVKRVVGNSETFIPRRPLAAPGEGTHFSVSTGGPVGDVTNEDYVGALVEFGNGARGTLEACRIINGPKCQMAFELNGTRGAISWDFERMNELDLYLPDESDAHNGPVRIQSGPEHPFHGHFLPGPALGLGFDHLKLIEAFRFSKSIADGQQGEPGFTEALAVAEVQDAMQRSWGSERWEEVRSTEE